MLLFKQSTILGFPYRNVTCAYTHTQEQNIVQAISKQTHHEVSVHSLTECFTFLTALQKCLL